MATDIPLRKESDVHLYDTTYAVAEKAQEDSIYAGKLRLGEPVNITSTGVIGVYIDPNVKKQIDALRDAGASDEPSRPLSSSQWAKREIERPASDAKAPYLR